ncbi:MAG TPA: lipoyl(octanoyl) transferase LipB [Solirubrobacteraceae bacterium]|jgi:lipoyl(octanoyl) transferase|nr:lipoyl(octanoyl) transferase LipB [Solirubrobacteraceae bacterium]
MRHADLPSEELWVCHLGLVPYSDGIAIQETLRERRLAGELPDLLLLLEHPPLYTRGRRSGAEDLPFGEDFYRARGIEIHTTDRGGRLTYHAPGQLVGYPIMAIEDIGAYLRTMEAAIIAALSEEGVTGRSRHDEGIDYTGVWVAERKIASIGVHVSRGVTTHGFALNVDVDLQPFSWVIACGLPGVAMTSLARELGPQRSTGLPCVRRRVAFNFANAHGRRQRLVSPRRLGIDTTNAAGLASGRAPIKTLPAAAAEPVPA